MKGALRAAAITGTLVLLSAGPARAADVDIDHLPSPDPQTLSSSIVSWTDTPFSSSITTWSIDGAVIDLEETTQESGQTVVTLDADILFEFAKAALPGAATHARIAKAIAKAPKGSAVSISGHTDDVGSDSANLKLSQARAQAVAAVVKAARPDLTLTVKGFGESKPVSSNGQAAGRSTNRRVEIRFPS